MKKEKNKEMEERIKYVERKNEIQIEKEKFKKKSNVKDGWD